jgi:hypothetical protein
MNEEQHIQPIVDKLISDKRDRTAHSYDDYRDDDERIIHLTVAEIRFLYNHFTGDDIDDY